MTHGADRRPECVNAVHDDCQIHAIPQVCSGSVFLFVGQASIHFITGHLASLGVSLHRGD